MRLAKNVIDAGLSANNLEPMLQFWQQDAGPVRSLDQRRKFCGDILGFAEQAWPDGTAFRLGDSLVALEEDSTAAVAAPRQAQGWRYITLQVVDIDAVHDGLQSKGVREELAPITLGDVARISMIHDPDRNWIELYAGPRPWAA